MRVIIGGGTGFIGKALAAALTQRGDEVVILSRSGGPDQLTWDAVRTEGLPLCDAVINLAGANVMARRWTATYKREIFSSRVDTSQLLARAIAQSPSPPASFIVSSAIAYYANGETSGETGRAGSNFLSLVAQAWEAASALPPDCPTHQATVRTGIVLGPDGGALARMLPLFRAGLGGPLGSGKQPFCWIHLDDLVALFLFALDQQLTGPFNGVAPETTSMAEFATALGKSLGKPARIPIPGWLLRAALGERASALVAGATVIPQRAPEAGFTYAYPSLDLALVDLARPTSLG